MNNDVTFGGWLRQRRRGLDLTQQELAQRVGCTVSTLRKIEAGERRPSKELATLLATCLDIAPEEYDRFITFARTEPYPDRPPPPPPATRSYGASSAPVVTTPLPPFLTQDTSSVEPIPVFVARERELAELATALENRSSGGSNPFVMAGLDGQTNMLVQEFARHAQVPILNYSSSALRNAHTAWATRISLSRSSEYADREVEANGRWLDHSEHARRLCSYALHDTGAGQQAPI